MLAKYRMLAKFGMLAKYGMLAKWVKQRVLAKPLKM